MPPIMWRTAPTVPPPPTIQQALRACRGLTVSDLKQDPNLLDALRRLRAATTGVDDVGRAKSASALIIKTTDINAIILIFWRELRIQGIAVHNPSMKIRSGDVHR